MNKRNVLIRLAAVALLLATAVSSVSCKDKADPEITRLEKGIIGKWYYRDGGKNNYYEFKKDKTVFFTVGDGEITSKGSKYVWEIKRCTVKPKYYDRFANGEYYYVEFKNANDAEDIAWFLIKVNKEGVATNLVPFAYEPDIYKNERITMFDDNDFMETCLGDVYLKKTPFN